MGGAAYLGNKTLILPNKKQREHLRDEVAYHYGLTVAPDVNEASMMKKAYRTSISYSSL